MRKVGERNRIGFTFTDAEWRKIQIRHRDTNAARAKEGRHPVSVAAMLKTWILLDVCDAGCLMSPRAKCCDDEHILARSGP